ncbi:hypothetical protein LXA43DRAFT_1099960 [Ganoderma leucocontextum]|nr:hypothetical protein LXA43DRAFT_1099960 [Ganoderma leucocontextum]
MTYQEHAISTTTDPSSPDSGDLRKHLSPTDYIVQRVRKHHRESHLHSNELEGGNEATGIVVHIPDPSQSAHCPSQTRMVVDELSRQRIFGSMRPRSPLPNIPSPTTSYQPDHRCAIPSIRAERQHPRATFNAYPSPEQQTRTSSPSSLPSAHPCIRAERQHPRATFNAYPSPGRQARTSSPSSSHSAKHPCTRAERQHPRADVNAYPSPEQQARTSSPSSLPSAHPCIRAERQHPRATFNAYPSPGQQARTSLSHTFKPSPSSTPSVMPVPRSIDLTTVIASSELQTWPPKSAGMNRLSASGPLQLSQLPTSHSWEEQKGKRVLDGKERQQNMKREFDAKLDVQMKYELDVELKYEPDF